VTALQLLAADEILLNSSVDNIWNILTDIPSYHRWWPKYVHLKISHFTKEIFGTQFEAKPLGGKSFSCKVVSIIPNREIRLNYFDGIYRGEGVWSIDKKESLILVSYKVDLEVVDKSIAMLSRVISIPKLHSLIFKRILKALEVQVKFP